MTPFGFDVSRRGMRVRGYTPRHGEDMEFHFNVVGPGYLEMMRIPLVAGRSITAEDRAGAPAVVVVNESFARRFWPGRNPLGQAISVSGPEGPWLEVVGVARDTKFVSLTDASRPFVYFPALQEPDWGVTLHVTGVGDVRRLAPAIRRAVQEAAPRWQVETLRTMDEQLGAALVPQRIAGAAMGLFGGVALLLASIGLYGVVAYAVAQRTREIGLRIALGATPSDVLRLMLRQGLVLTSIGVVVGLAAALAVTRLLSAFLLGTSVTDPAAFAVAALLLGAIAVTATYIPARRATRVDPMMALRYE
jgi:predicted permease